MSTAANGPWPVTEEEYLSLGETAERVELFDGRIPWYLIADPRRDLTLRLFRLEGSHFVLDGVGRAGQPLRMTSPVVVDLDPADLEL